MSSTKAILGIAAAAGLVWLASGSEKAHQAPKLVSRATEKVVDKMSAPNAAPSWGYPDSCATTADQTREVCMGD